MSRMRVFVSRDLPGDALNRLKGLAHVVNEPPVSTYRGSELIQALEEVEGIVSTLNDPIDRNVMEKAGKTLRVISNYAVGYNNIDVDEATRRGIVVCNTPGVLTDATADMGFAMVMAIARQLHRAHIFTEKGDFKGWEPDLFLGLPVFRKTLGIVGMGKIGQAIAARARGFEMEILYHNRNPLAPEVEETLKAEWSPLEELLRTSDFVLLSIPLSESTRGMIGKRELGIMKKSACLVNISRGEVVREGELCDALAEGKIRAAALDVYEKEPSIHPRLFELDNVLLLPHIGSATEDARREMGELCVDNLLAVLTGKRPEASVNYALLSGGSASSPE